MADQRNHRGRRYALHAFSRRRLADSCLCWSIWATGCVVRLCNSCRTTRSSGHADCSGPFHRRQCGGPGPDLSDAYGAAFEESGRALLRMERGEHLKIAGTGISPLLAAFIDLLAGQISDWTAEQAQAMALALPPDAPTQTALATSLGITPQALSYRLAGARWPAIRRVLQEWEKPRPPEEHQE